MNNKKKEKTPQLTITHSGKAFDLRHMTHDDICLDDIAHHLTKECRYGGAMELDQHYSVCQHSLALCNYALHVLENKDMARWLLMHDASEYILKDIPSPLKALLPEYVLLEEKITKLIFEKYKIPTPKYLDELVVKELDTRILLDEACLFVPIHNYIFLEACPNLSPIEFTQLMSEDNDYKYVLKQLFIDTAHFLGVTDDE